MRRVGFLVGPGLAENWIGGFNYLLNLFTALKESGNIQPVIFGPGAAHTRFRERVPWVECVHFPFAELSGLGNYVRKGSVKLTGRDLPLNMILRRHKIDALSHSVPLVANEAIPNINWIADFQYEHLPHMFDDAQRAYIKAGNDRMVASGRTILVSSRHAKGDLERIHPDAIGRNAVLRFVSGILPTEATPRAELEERYDLGGPFFYFPGQVWLSKNHRTVIRALAEARRAGRPVTVVSTGAAWDFRAPRLLEELKEEARELGCEADFRQLGIVPYADVAGLMHHSVAMINASLFEGWSTTVEESKSLGKIMILSSIPVHVEQDPEHGVFFEPTDHEALAARLIETLDGFSEEAENRRREAANAALPGRFKGFGERYERIVEATLDPSRPDPDNA